MPAPETPVSSQIYVKIDGNPIPDKTINNLLEAVVDQNTHLPHMFLLRFEDSNLELTDGSLFDTAKEVEIEASDDSGTKHLLFKGEITAIEPIYSTGQTIELVVRGFDKSHRMYREVKSRSFLNKKDSDIASQIAGEHGLSTAVESTSAVYQHIYQHNQTDLAFLMERAWRIGFECFVEEEKLYFRKPPKPSSASAISLNYGADLQSYQPSLTLAEQVDEVMVKGWDSTKQEAIVGKAKSGELYASTALGTGNSKASSFGTGKKTIVNLPVISQAEANTLAQARLNEISASFIQASGVAFRRPDIRAGKSVDLVGLGRRFSGKYFVTGTRHIYTSEGLSTEFEVSGMRSGVLAEQMSHQEPMERWPGAVVAKVTDTNDPDGLGRVKVKYPWMSDEADSWWARVISPGAGPEAGFFVVPEVEDEVMVVFEHGDFNQPYILGGVWNGKNKIPPPGAGAAAGEKPQVRSWHSIKGHHISVYDNADDKIEIVTVSGHTLVLDDANKKVTITTSGGQKFDMDDSGSSITLETSGTVDVKSTGATTVKSSGDLTLESSMNVKIKAGGMMDINASGPVNVKGAVVNLN